MAPIVQANNSILVFAQPPDLATALVIAAIAVLLLGLAIDMFIRGNEGMADAL